jgi:hypothetical protein
MDSSASANRLSDQAGFRSIRNAGLDLAGKRFEVNAPLLTPDYKHGEYKQKITPTQDHLSMSQRRLRGVEDQILKKSREKFKILQIM